MTALFDEAEMRETSRAVDKKLLANNNPKKKVEILDEFKPYFIYGSGDAVDPHTGKPYNIKGCVANGVSEEIAQVIWDKMYEFAKYAFNKSHGAAYAVITAQTAWLSTYYPVIFMKANMNTYIGSPKKLKAYLGSAQQGGIKILPPSVNESVEMFSLNAPADAIRFGLMGVKNVGKVSYDILAERNARGNFSSMQNFIERMLKYQKINSRALEALIYVGALDEFAGTRAAKIAYLGEYLDIVKDDKGIDYGFDTIFDLADEVGVDGMVELKDVQIPYLDEMDKDELYAKENEFSGFYITGHPLEDYQMVMKMENVIPSTMFSQSDEDEENGTDFATTYEGLKVKVAGIIDELEEKLTKTGKTMATFELKDMMGSVPVIAFDGTLKKFKVKEGQKVLITGTVSVNDFGVQIKAIDICPLSMADTSIKDVWLYANTDAEKSKIQRKQLLKLVAGQNQGSVRLHFYHKDFSFDNMYVNLNLEMFNELQKIFGEKNCTLRKMFNFQ
jgi:DNA polymerase-3 subunit alpha